MSTSDPDPSVGRPRAVEGATAPDSSPPAATTPVPRDPASGAERHRNWWPWIAAGLAVVAIGLLVWGLHERSDANDAQAKLEQSQQTQSTLASSAKKAYNSLTAQLGLANESAAASEQAVKDAEAQSASSEKAAQDAQQAAKQAEQSASDSQSQAKAAQAEATAATAELKAAESKLEVARQCGQAYVSAIGTLFDGNDPKAQAASVGDQLRSITAECKTALGVS